MSARLAAIRAGVDYERETYDVDSLAAMIEVNLPDDVARRIARMGSPSWEAVLGYCVRRHTNCEQLLDRIPADCEDALWSAAAGEVMAALAETGVMEADFRGLPPSSQ